VSEEYLLDLEIEPLDEGGFVATSPQVQGLVAQGRTLAETLEIARDVARKIVESCIEHGDPLPALRKKPRRRLAASVPVSVAQ
jgi:predicted RNase H-like HicB family nuclease